MAIHPLRFARRHWKELIALAIVNFAAINLLAARHARAFLTYAPEGDATAQPEQLSTSQKVGLLFTGVSVPRPRNSSDPASLGLPFTTNRIGIGEESLEIWQIPAHPSARGLVVLFPGYSSAKSSLLAEAAAFRAMGFDSILIDFRGVGGSSGSNTTLGIREGEDVRAVVKWVEQREPNRRVILFGRSMGSVAILRAVAHHDVRPAAVILECPFDRMLNAIRNRFEAMGAPSFPGAELLLFWGGRRLNFNGFDHNSIRDAAQLQCPALVLAGAQDRRARSDQVQAVFQQIPGEKRFHIFENAGHEPFRSRDPGAWDREIGDFLRGHLP
jgi:pimeloyl-ACP methyl ester carboxylesterase